MPDADNISKPIWDALRGIAYRDDKEVVYRAASIQDLTITEFEAFDLTGVEPKIVADLVDAVANPAVKDFVYVELGTFKESLIRFNLEA